MAAMNVMPAATVNARCMPPTKLSLAAWMIWLCEGLGRRGLSSNADRLADVVA